MVMQKKINFFRAFTFSILILFLVIPVYAQDRPDALRSYRIGRDTEGRSGLASASEYYEDAIRICLDELNQNNTNMDSYAVLTWALQRQQRFNEVIEWGSRGLLITTDYRIIETMGEAYFYLGNFNRCLQYMQRYVNALPRGERASVAYFFCGEIYRNRRMYHHADIAYTTAVQLDSSLPLWWFRLGQVREALEDYSPAIVAYEQALRLNPGYQDASAGLSRSRQQAN